MQNEAGGRIDSSGAAHSYFFVDPVNEISEKKKFFLNKNHNPVFHYRKTRNETSLLHELKNLDSCEGADIIKKLIETEIAYCSLKKSCGSSEFTKKSISLYRAPGKELLERAIKILGVRATFSEKQKLSPDYISARISQYIKEKKIPGWDVKTAAISSKAITLCKKRTLIVNKDILFSETDLKRLIAHEVDGHIMRFENSQLQPPVLRFRLPGALATEEGLGIFSEEKSGVLDQQRLAVCAARVVAVDMALTSSFLEVFQYISGFFDDDLTWEITVRVKRGLSDTSMPGGFTKDYLYLKGYYEVKKYVENGGSIRDLYVAKIGIGDIARVKKIKGLVPPKYIPSYEHS